MKRFLGRTGAALVLTGGAALLASSSGCADNESSLYVRHVLAGDETCVFTADPEAAFIGGGVLDVAFRSEYHAALLVGNQLVQRGEPEKLRTETSRITLYAADVSIYYPSGDVVARADSSAASFSIPVSGFVDPGDGSEPGYGIAPVTLIDAQTALDLGGTIVSSGLVQDVVAGVIVRGRTLGGNELETPEFQFPIAVCFGCLLDFPSEADDPTTAAVDCDVPGQPAASCRLGQDRRVDCRDCLENPICRP
jgi:hypothetical protein